MREAPLKATFLRGNFVCCPGLWPGVWRHLWAAVPAAWTTFGPPQPPSTAPAELQSPEGTVSNSSSATPDQWAGLSAQVGFPRLSGAPESRRRPRDTERGSSLAKVGRRSSSAETPAHPAPAWGLRPVCLSGGPSMPALLSDCSRLTLLAAPGPRSLTTISLQRFPQQPWALTCPGPRVGRGSVRPARAKTPVGADAGEPRGRPTVLQRGSGHPRKAGFPPSLHQCIQLLVTWSIALPTFDAPRPRHSDRIGDHFCQQLSLNKVDDKPIFSICRLSGI